MSQKFTHLHLHTEYSLLDGAIRLKDLFPRAKEYGYDSVAMTDHGVMYGAINFYEQALKHDIKPVLGCEVYMAPGSRFDKKATSQRKSAYHLVLLAADMTGYKNLLKLVTKARFEGFHYKPRVDFELLEEFNQGIIALSACLQGEIPRTVLDYGVDKARETAERYASIFKDRFYLELQENGIEEQHTVNRAMVDMARELGLPLVATNDCHYLNRGDDEAHDVLLCIQTGKTVKDKERMRFTTDSLYFTSQEEMERLFSWCPEALSNTVDIAARCNLSLELGKHHFPVYTLEEGETYESRFEREARKGYERRLKELGISGEARKVYDDRLEIELDVIKSKGFASYFLIVADFINWAKEHDIPVGPGRGSGAGSLVAYSMRITELDPVKYGLFFERFLNVERESLPDFDVDFCMKKRDQVIDYVSRKYGGEDFVGQIITFGQMKAKAVIRDVGRAMGMPYKDVDRIAKLIPDGMKMTLEKAFKMEPELKKLEKEDPEVRGLMKVARALEGLPRHSSTHAAGVVMSDRPMVEYLPLTKGQKNETITQFDMVNVEKAGLVKFDFLGLKTLTVIDTALKLIKEHTGEEIDISKIPLDDPETFQLLQRGDTTGVFQLESSGMKDLLRRMKPTMFTDMIALVALYRPGPLESGMVDQFVKAKHGEIEVTYLLPELEPILKETYGVIVYQEQVMQIAQKLAGYSLGEGDLLRRAMGKKKPEVMEAQRKRFMDGAERLGHPLKAAKTIFDLMEKFAGYGFNKSHSAAYALISYQTAWLKTHYLVPFMASLMSNELGNTTGVVKFINDAREMEIKILPPDVNFSKDDFTIEDNNIRFGLTAVKNVGEGAIEVIVKEREAKGRFKNIEDFCSRVDLRKVNRKVIESLIKCGAFDSMGHRRSQLMEIIDQAISFGQEKRRERMAGQLSLFDIMPKRAEEKDGLATLTLPDIPEWDSQERLALEKEALGFFISGHPLDSYREKIRQLACANTETIKDFPDKSEITICGHVMAKKEVTTKKGDRMAFITIEDLHGSVETVCFPDTYKRYRDMINSERPLWIEGTLHREDTGQLDENNEKKTVCKIIPNTMDLLDEACSKNVSGLSIEINASATGPEKMDAIKNTILFYKGDYPVKMNIRIPGEGSVSLELPHQYSAINSDAFSDAIEAITGYRCVTALYDTGNRQV